MTETNFISTYRLIIRTCIDSANTESLQIVIKQLYSLSQLTALKNENSNMQKAFQKLALLCKKFLKTGKSLDKIENFLENLKLPKEIINQKTGIRTTLELGKWVMVKELLCYSEDISHSFVYNENNKITLYEYELHDPIFSIEVRREAVEIDDQLLIDDGILKILGIERDFVKVEVLNEVLFMEYRVSKTSKKPFKFFFEVVNGVCFIQVEEGRVFKRLKEIIEVENHKFRRGFPASFFQAGNEVFQIV